MQQDRLDEATTLVAAPLHPAGMTDAQLLEQTERWEALGRLADARRIALAGELEWRSREQLGEGSLARRRGDRNGAELLAREARIGVREARRRIALGIRLRPRLSLQGEELPGRYPSVAAAMNDGAIGQDAARVIVEALGAVARRADPEGLVAAEAALVASAHDLPPDLVQVQAAVWQARLDPDGAEPSDAAAQRGRSFRIGAPRSDGTTRSVIIAPSEGTALLRAILNAHRRGVQWARTGADDCEDDLEWHEASGDGRSTAQFDFDTVMAVLQAGVRAESDARVASGASPVEVVVQVSATELERHRGTGWLDDVLARIPTPQVRRMQCSGGTRLLVTGGAGEPL